MKAMLSAGITKSSTLELHSESVTLIKPGASGAVAPAAADVLVLSVRAAAHVAVARRSR